MQDQSRGHGKKRDGAAAALAIAVPLSETDYRARLVQGMAEALMKKGYTDVSVADIVQHARVSKRTFYEHFADKEACYLATYAALSDDLMARVAEAGATDRPAEERLVAATHAYLAALEERPALTRTFLTEIQAAGPEALKLRRSIHQRFSELLRLLVERGRKERPGLLPISPPMAVALVGGINELVLLTIEEGRGQHLSEIGDTVVELLRAVLVARPKRAGARRIRRRTRKVSALALRRTA
jgi:AcrR family transcriptional regulator